VLLALTSDQKLGLAGAAAVFIVFALVCSLVIPRRYPDFPGSKGLGLFIVVTLVLMVAMLGAVVVFADEDESEAAGHGEPAVTETTGGTTTAPPDEAAGDAEKGRSVYDSNGCGGCHTYEPAGSQGAVGPNLDESLQGKDPAYIERAIVDPNADVAQGFQPGVMPAFDQLSEEQVADLVAFLSPG
jgi:mono/diheme cytochrome c family protein